MVYQKARVSYCFETVIPLSEVFIPGCPKGRGFITGEMGLGLKVDLSPESELEKGYISLAMDHQFVLFGPTTSLKK